MTTPRRADAALRIPSGHLATLVARLRRMARSVLSLVRCVVLAGLSACTLLDEPFEPLAVTEVDAGIVPELEASGPSSSENAASDGCATEGAEGRVSGSGAPACSEAIVGIDQGSLEPLAAAPDASAPQPPTLSEPCSGTLGEFGAPERIAGLGFADNVFGPALSADGRTLYFSGYVAGEQQIYAATRSERGLGFSNVTLLSAVNSPRMDGTPFPSADGRRLYLFSERDGGVGDRDIWVSQRRGDDFDAPDLVASINSGASDLLPWLSADEMTLLFVSSRFGGRGSADIWRATRDDVDEPFDTPVNAFELSSNQAEGRAVLSADQLTVYFTSDRMGGRGAPDIWTASRERANQPFSAPRNLWPLNSNFNDQDVMLSSDDTELFFASNRLGGPSELWRAERACL